MKATEIMEEFADIVTQTVKQPFREQPLTDDELDTIADRLVRLVDDTKEETK